MEKITAYKDVKGGVHQSRVECEVANLCYELGVEQISPNLASDHKDEILNLVNKMIDTGKKAARLKKLTTGR